jgi:hypothetical protein
MAIPLTPLFGVCDWNSRAATTAIGTDLLITDAVDSLAIASLVEGTAPLTDTLWFGADATWLGGLLVARTRAQLTGLTIPASFSFEFDIQLTAELPVDFSNPDNRVFVAAIRQQGVTAGLLFSHQGIAIATAPDEPSPTALGGSASLLVDDDGVLHPSLTVRISVDAAANTMTIMAAPTALAYNELTGGTLWAEQPDLEALYTVQTRSTTLAIGEGVLVWGTACSSGKIALLNPGYVGLGQSVTFGISSLRVSTAIVPLVPRPVSVVSAASQVMVGNEMVLRGDGSYDLSAAPLPLTFAWEIDSAPEGSVAAIEGADHAELEILTNLVIRYRVPTAIANSFAVVLVAQTHVTDELSISFVSGTLTIRLGMKFDNLGILVPRSTGADVVTAFSSPFSPAYCPDVATIFAVSVGSGGGEAALTPGTYLFSGATQLGSGSTLHNPTFIPDKPGQYVFSLVVSNGTRPSLAATHAVLSTVTEQLVGHRPNADYIFKHISDFWNMVPDRAQLSSIWSATMQAVSSEMLAAMQHDHAKALRDISRRYQRRWLNYRAEVDPAIIPTFTHPGRINVVGITVPDSPTGYSSAIASVTDPGALPFAAGTRVLLRNSLEAPSIVTVNKITGTGVPLDPWVLHAAPGSFTRYRLEGTGKGRFVRDPELPAVSTSVLFQSNDYSVSAFDKDLDQVRLTLQTGPPNAMVDVVAVNPPRGTPFALANKVPMANTLQFLEAPPAPFGVPAIMAQTVDGQRLTFEHLRVGQGSHVAAYPYFLYPDTIDLADLGLTIGDLATVEVTDPRTGVVMPVMLPIVAIDSRAVFVQWTPLVEMLTLLAPLGPYGDGVKKWTTPDLFYSALPDWTLKMLGFRRSRRLPGYTDLVSVPHLGSTVQAQLYESTDYSVLSGDVWLKDWLIGTATTTPGSADVTIEAATQHVSFPTGTTLKDLQDVGATIMVMPEGDAGVYRIVGRSALNKFTLDRLVSIGGKFPVYLPRRHHLAPLPTDLWGEISYFDNYAAIEGRYGLYVGVPKSLLDQYADGADYLTTVRTLWFAFLNGPTLDNLRLPLQALMNLPCSEATGQITKVVEPTVEVAGLITMVSQKGVTYTYQYPYGVDIGINPRTGRQFRAAPLSLADVITEKTAELEAQVALGVNATLTAQQLLDLAAIIESREELLADAWVDQFTRLVEVVRVDDYISNPALVDRELRGNQLPRRYHTFVVDVPLRVARSTQMFPLMRQILDTAKAAHTNYILVGSIPISDDIEVESVLTLFPTLLLHDSIATSPWTAPKDGVGAQGQAAVSLANENLLWPQEGADVVFPLAQYPTKVLDTTVARIGEVKERYEAGYVEGAADNYSGDGSFNTNLKVVDQVNRLDVSSIDVCRSYLWVRVNITSGAFLLGEQVRLGDAGLVDLPTLWATSPPTIEYVGAGHDPYLPEVVEPQSLHPYTYLLLGFQYVPPLVSETRVKPEFLEPNTVTWTNVTDLGIEARLDALDAGATAAGGIANVRVIGLTSGSVATPLDAIDHTNVAYDPYCLLDRVMRADKLLDYGPESRVTMTVSTYIPLGGMLIDDFVNVNRMAVARDTQYERALQSKPWRPAAPPASQQFVPSMGPGMFVPTDLNNFVAGLADDGTPLPATSANTYVRWGYKDRGVLEVAEGGAFSLLTSFQYDETKTYLRNVHAGLTVRPKKWWQHTHGFTQFQVPPPKIVQVVHKVATPTLLQVEGHNFVEEDVTDTGAGAQHDQLDGTYGGSWVFIQLSTGGPLIPATSTQFMVGADPVDPVLWYPATLLDRTGLVLQATFAVAPADGTYDVVVRQYRRYPADAGPGPHIDTSVALSAAVWAAGAWTASYGTNPVVAQGAGLAEFYW